jgi:hypothetical protein
MAKEAASQQKEKKIAKALSLGVTLQHFGPLATSQFKLLVRMENCE